MSPAVAPQWREVTLTLTGPDSGNAYVDVEAWVDFVHDDGSAIRRPVYWDGGTSYAVRFASTRSEGRWTWQLYAEDPGHRFSPTAGTLAAAPAPAHPHPALTRGFLTADPSGRTFRYADGTSAFLVIDTAWAMPWRATLTEVQTYATDRQDKGFNAVLLMSVQPDMHACGPVGRGVDEGFAVGFADLSVGHLNRLEPAYFREVDQILQVLIDHGITPVLQPVFQGFGWKGLEVAGTVVPPDEYARYCRYLVARYGARPAIYLPGADGAGDEPQTEAGGRAIQASDAYAQPTGIHYRPHHRNDVHQDADWLDFQSCQTGHGGDHIPDRVATMWAQRPVKAVINGEPSYEQTGHPDVAAGWWQGHEAWSNLCAGATMGVAYGAASLWQWRLHPAEPGHEPFFLAADAGWREALDFEGSCYVGLVGRLLAGLPTAGLSPCWDVSLNGRGLLDPGVLYVGYAEHGGPWLFLDSAGRVPPTYWLLDPRTGALLDQGTRPPDGTPIPWVAHEPTVLICSEVPPAVVGG